MKFASSASISSTDVLLIMGEALVVECEATAAPLLVFTVPGIRLKISSHMTSNGNSECDVEALGVLGGLQGLDNFVNFLSQQMMNFLALGLHFLCLLEVHT